MENIDNRLTWAGILLLVILLLAEGFRLTGIVNIGPLQLGRPTATPTREETELPELARQPTTLEDTTLPEATDSSRPAGEVSPSPPPTQEPLPATPLPTREPVKQKLTLVRDEDLLAIQKSFEIELGEGEIIVGQSWEFIDKTSGPPQLYERCVAYLMTGPGRFSFSVLDGHWWQYANATPEDAKSLLQGQVDSLAAHQPCPGAPKEVRIPSAARQSASSTADKSLTETVSGAGCQSNPPENLYHLSEYTEPPWSPGIYASPNILDFIVDLGEIDTHKLSQPQIQFQVWIDPCLTERHGYTQGARFSPLTPGIPSKSTRINLGEITAITLKKDTGIWGLGPPTTQPLGSPEVLPITTPIDYVSTSKALNAIAAPLDPADDQSSLVDSARNAFGAFRVPYSYATIPPPLAGKTLDTGKYIVAVDWYKPDLDSIPSGVSVIPLQVSKDGHTFVLASGTWGLWLVTVDQGAEWHIEKTGGGVALKIQDP